MSFLLETRLMSGAWRLRKGKRNASMIFENQEGICREALFADENEEFRIPAEPDAGQSVVLRFRAARDNIDCVYYKEEGA